MRLTRIHVYWLTWAVIVAAVLVIHFFVMDPNADRGRLAAVFMNGTWLPVMALGAYEAIRLTRAGPHNRKARMAEARRFALFAVSVFVLDFLVVVLLRSGDQ